MLGQENITQMGAPPSMLRQAGSPVTTVPSVDPEIRGCQQQLGEAAVECWTHLDQYLVTDIPGL